MFIWQIVSAVFMAVDLGAGFFDAKTPMIEALGWVGLFMCWLYWVREGWIAWRARHA